MAKVNLNPKTLNQNIGIGITESHLMPQSDWGIDFGFYASLVKAETAGTIVWYNKYTDETGCWIFEAGETYMIMCTSILLNATIDTVAYATTVARDAIWIAGTANAVSIS